MGEGSCSEGHGFESWHHILDGHFLQTFAVKIKMFIWKGKNKLKEAGDGQLKNKF